MNRIQKFFILLWVVTTIVATGLLLVVTERGWWLTYAGGYAVVSLILLGMVWVMADKKPSP